MINNTLNILPPWPRLGKKIESATRKALFTYSMLTEVDRLGIALSGGKDSLALLLMLHAILGRGAPNPPLMAFHISTNQSTLNNLHMLCNQLHVPLFSHPLKGMHDNCYSCSRERRKQLFTMAKQHNCHTIAFGHHQDDNAQTTLMNLLHKGEFAGMLPKITLFKYACTIIRPLIYIPEENIRKFINNTGLSTITCHCPFGETRLRKKTASALETLEKLYPNARNNVAQAALMYGSTKAQNI